MKRVLIVDDEPNFLTAVVDGLAPFSSLDVVTAANGREALAVLQRPPETDLLVTDLNMPTMDGFELLAHLSGLRHRPPTIVISAFGSADARARLEQLGDLTLLEKPLDIDALTDRIFAALTPGDRGYLPGISLASFLQLLQMERKTCHLAVASGPSSGDMCVSEGQVIYARAGRLTGEAAAHEIIGWGEARIGIDALCRNTERNVAVELGFLIMESLRLQDERAAARAGAADVDVDLAFDLVGGAPPPPPPAASPAAPPHPTQPTREKTMSIESQLQSLRDIKGYRASAVLNFTGEVLVVDSSDPTVDLALVGATFNDIFRAAHEASKKIGLDATRETVIKTPKGLIVMACSGAEAKVHFHFIAVLGEDGNQALLKMRVDQMMPKILDNLA